MEQGIEKLLLLVLVFAAFALVLMNGVGGGRSMSSGDLNKKAIIRTIKTEAGMDLCKQPALNHPLLKNHKIQMKPTSLPKRFERKANLTTSSTPSQKWLKNVECPQGTTPILRVGNEVLRKANIFPQEIGVRPPLTKGHHWNTKLGY